MSLAGVKKKGKKCYQVYGQNNGKISYKSKKLPKTKSGNIFFAFLEHCFENKLAGRTHSVYGQKEAKISYKSKKSPKTKSGNIFRALF
jgi:hypothetical protein